MSRGTKSKVTGMVRRIDDLGRIVIPKEIRKTQRIRENDSMEIELGSDGEVVLRKYSAIGGLSTYALEIAESIATVTGQLICITDMEKVVIASGRGARDYMGKAVSYDLFKLMEGRRSMDFTAKEGCVSIAEGVEANYSGEAVAVIEERGDVLGTVVIAGVSEGEWDAKLSHELARTASLFLGKVIE